MKNPFEKTYNGSLVAAITLGSIAAGALTYLFLTDSGAAVRGNIKKKAKKKAKALVAKAISKKTGISKKAVKAVTDHVA